METYARSTNHKNGAHFPKLPSFSDMRRIAFYLSPSTCFVFSVLHSRPFYPVALAYVNNLIRSNYLHKTTNIIFPIFFIYPLCNHTLSNHFCFSFIVCLMLNLLTSHGLVFLKFFIYTLCIYTLSNHIVYFRFSFIVRLMLNLLIIIVIVRFLERPQKRSRRNQLIHRHLTKTKSIGSGQDPESQADSQTAKVDGTWS